MRLFCAFDLGTLQRTGIFDRNGELVRIEGDESVRNFDFATRSILLNHGKLTLLNQREHRLMIRQNTEKVVLLRQL